MMGAVVAYTYDPAAEGQIRAALSVADGLVVARRGDALLETDGGVKTRTLFERVMALPAGQTGDITDIYTEIVEGGSPLAIVLCWKDAGFTAACPIGRDLNAILRKTLGGVQMTPAPFWLTPP